MKKILSIFWIITLWLFNFWYCADIINPWDYYSISSSTTYSAWSDMIICADWWWWYFDYMWNSIYFNWFPSTCIVLTINDIVNVSVWGSTLIKWYYLSCPSSSCSSCENQLSQCESALSSCDTDYTDCKSDLYNCEHSNSCDYSWYILESSIDTQYCMINWLCPSSTWDIVVEGSGFSSVYIYSDNRYFPITWTNNIFVNLPSYLWFNYDYSNWWEDLDIDLWYVVDSWYISDIKGIQGSIPNEVDFNNIVKYLLPLFVPWLCVILLLYFIFRFVKKIF